MDTSMILVIGALLLLPVAVVLVMRRRPRDRGYAWAKADHAAGSSLSHIMHMVEGYEGEFREGVFDYLEEAGHPDFR